MNKTLSPTQVVRLCQYLWLVVGLVFLAGCATAKIPGGREVYATQTHPDRPKIGVAKCRDTRASEKSGSVGLASISVKKEDLENLVTNYLLQCLNRQLKVNVERVSAETAEEVKGLATSVGVKGVLVSTVTKVHISSADAAMDPAEAVLECEVWLYDGTGRQVFHELVTGKHTEWIGFKLVDKATGQLVDVAARELGYELGNRLEAQGALKALD